MTLNLTIVNPWGIWQCSDHRLTDTVTGKLVDDYSIKHVILRCPDGAALLAYAGAGRINSLDLSDWLREILRGESRTLDQTCIHIRNFDPLAGGIILNHFDTVAKEISHAGQGFIFGGDPGAVVPSDQKRLMTIAAKKPRHPKDFRKLLAS